MTDLTKIEKPFGLLDKETQAALKAHKGPIEFFLDEGWGETKEPAFYGIYAYRAKPLTLPAWPPGLDDKWQWIAMDVDGEVYAFEDKPLIEDSVWLPTGRCYEITGLFVGLNFDGIPWRDAIIQRPEGV